jgi:DNA-binding CsgD family transcriptional regulator
VLAVVDASPLPVSIIELPSEIVVAASSTAAAMLGSVESITGRYVEDLLAGTPTGGLQLVRDGRLSGYETTRRLAPDGKRSIRIWVRALSLEPPVQHVLTVLSVPDDKRAGLHALRSGDPGRAPVIGTADRALVVDRISSDVESLVGIPAADVLQRSILHFVREPDAAALLVAVAEATASGRGTSVQLSLRGPDDVDILSDVAIVPLAPAPSFAFAITDAAGVAPASDAATARLLDSFGRMVDCVDTSKLLAENCRPVPGLERLSTRELHIVGRLLEGDRVPAIAASLFLSQSTVRNHLSSVFGKLGVASQQELISLLRRKRDASSSG